MNSLVNWKNVPYGGRGSPFWGRDMSVNRRRHVYFTTMSPAIVVQVDVESAVGVYMAPLPPPPHSLPANLFAQCQSLQTLLDVQ